jgi:hypothetical protein
MSARGKLGTHGLFVQQQQQALDVWPKKTSGCSSRAERGGRVIWKWWWWRRSKSGRAIKIWRELLPLRKKKEKTDSGRCKIFYFLFFILKTYWTVGVTIEGNSIVVHYVAKIQKNCKSIPIIIFCDVIFTNTHTFMTS